jgi:hypothetical protein
LTKSAATISWRKNRSTSLLHLENHQIHLFLHFLYQSWEHRISSTNPDIHHTSPPAMIQHHHTLPPRPSHSTPPTSVLWKIP